MSGIIRKATLATALAATAITGMAATATPAEARDYRGGGGEYHGGGGGDAGAAIIGGIIGLGIGAAIASSNQPRYVEPAPVYYAPPPAYYAPQPVAYVVSPQWVWRDGFYWDSYGRRYFRDGRPCNDGYGRRGYYGGYYGHEWREHGGR